MPINFDQVIFRNIAIFLVIKEACKELLNSNQIGLIMLLLYILFRLVGFYQKQ